jgi:hypothetical protein
MSRSMNYQTAVTKALEEFLADTRATGRRRQGRVSVHLANHVFNKIRRSDPERPTWQRPNWRARHKQTGRMRPVIPRRHEQGIAGLIEEDERLILAHTRGDRLRLRATLAFLNDRIEPSLSVGGNRGSAAILLTDTAAQLCAALFDRRDYPPRAALFDWRSQSTTLLVQELCHLKHPR